ncbi:MAG: hypothetical protein HQL65_14970 [Magnetococcales bacterium]|nr:hypothetical protein [Magnetococcales bacterium]
MKQPESASSKSPEHILKKKLQYFFSSQYRGRKEIQETLLKIEKFGRMVLIGGMIRDIALWGNLRFHSDLDFVIDPTDLNAFEKSMLTMQAKQNRFGGYSLSLEKWRIDVWPLQKTWAQLAGHVMVKTFDDLIKVTFFDCDAIIYNIAERKMIYKPDYFVNLNRRVLDVNLKPNPNPIGNAVRAFRYAFIKKLSWGQKLSGFILETIDAVGWEEIAEKEKQSFKTDWIASFLDKSAFEYHLRCYLSVNDSTCFDPDKFIKRPTQLHFQF